MLKFQYFGHVMRRADSFENTLILGKIGGKRRRGKQRMSSMCGLDNKDTHHLGNPKCSQVTSEELGHIPLQVNAARVLQHIDAMSYKFFTTQQGFYLIFLLLIMSLLC